MENTLSFLFILTFLFALVLGYFIGLSDAKRPRKKPKTTTITIAANSSIRAGDTIRTENATYEVKQVGHFFATNGGCSTTLLVEKLKGKKNA